MRMIILKLNPKDKKSLAHIIATNTTNIQWRKMLYMLKIKNFLIIYLLKKFLIIFK